MQKVVLENGGETSLLPHNAAMTDGSLFFGDRVLLEREVQLVLEVPLV